MSSVEFARGIDEVASAEWNALEGAAHPFLRHEFLAALEASDSVGADSGWQAEHLLVRNGRRLLAAMPCYGKQHSYGEYVFDWAWADAYARQRLAYYPKLVSAVPFTPATGPRLLLADGIAAATVWPQLLGALRDVLGRRRLSSWHLLFPDAPQAAVCAVQPGLLRRTGVQFHWRNRGYADFDHFLGQLVSRKRKGLRRERRVVAEQGLELLCLRGPEIDRKLWDRFYLFYQSTYARRSGHGGYLSRDFFHRLGATMPERLLLVIARVRGEPVAGALNVIGEDALYGRYWGCLEEYAQLHFETCYYQGIEFCIREGLSRFDAGAQGEHKLARGFEPVLTESFHLIAHPGFREAIAAFLAREQIAMERYRQEAIEALPYRQATAEEA